MPSISWSRFSEEFLGLYGPPFGARATKAKYRQVLQEFQAIGISKTSHVSPASIAKWVKAHQDRSPLTNLNLLKHFRHASQYLVCRGYLRNSPFSTRPVSKWIEAELPDCEDFDDDETATSRHLSIEQIGKVLALLGSPESLRTWQGRRLFALTSLVAFTGVRKMEALRAEVSDFDLVKGVFRVRRRSNRLKTRASAAPVPLAPKVIPILSGWLPETGARWAFPGNRRRGPWTGGMFGSTALDEMRSSGERVGVPGFGFLRLRHSFATHAESWGLTELEIQRILRHTSPVTSRKWYRHADLPNLKRAVRDIGFENRSEPTG